MAVNKLLELAIEKGEVLKTKETTIIKDENYNAVARARGNESELNVPTHRHT
jgi:hypothetical protein